MRTRLLRYGPSRGSIRLKKALQEKGLSIKAVSLIHTNYIPRQKDIVINWGLSKKPENWKEEPLWVNNPLLVCRAISKLAFFETMKAKGLDYIIPPFTTSKDEAREMADKKWGVICRTMLRAQGGRGVVFCDNPEAVPNAPLYTQYMPKKHEYRIHIVGDKIVDVQQKKIRRGANVNYKVRTHDGDWVFCRTSLEAPDVVLEAAFKAVKHMLLDFGAADVGYNTQENKATVYEINTAPGIEGTTVDNYSSALMELLDEYK